MKQTQRNFIVQFKDTEEGNYLVQLLVQNGYENLHRITTCEGMRAKVILIADTTFYTTNITCLAAACSCNKNFKDSLITVDDFIATAGLNTNLGL